jgi:hypothetical protein
MGYENAYEYEGGKQDWIEAGYPTETGWKETYPPVIPAKAGTHGTAATLRPKPQPADRSTGGIPVAGEPHHNAFTCKG